jgi:hypothetical protein
MKRIVSLLATLCLFQSSHAATAVPDAISYQGRALTATGALMGAGTPVNRTVIFRIWDHPSNSLVTNLIYSEQQVVTIAEGEFSVLVGTGAATAGTPLTYSETTKGPPTVKISDAFGEMNRYLGVTIDDGTTAVDNEISPRQQIVSGAFALRSKFAESIGSATDLTLTPLSGTASNYGLGWYGTDRLFATTAVDGPVLYGNAGGALGSNVDGTQKLALRWDTSGRVGIGATSITSGTNKLTLQGDMATTPGDQLTIRGNTDNNKRLLLGYDTTANKASLQSYSALSTTAPLLLNPSGGNVGVNNTGPSVALDVTGAIKASTSIVAGHSIAANGQSGHIFSGTGDIDGGLFSPADGTVTLKTNNIERVRVDPLGNVGVNNAAPSVALDVTGAIKASGNIAAIGAITVSTIYGTPMTLSGSSDASTGAWIRNDGTTVFSTHTGDMHFGFNGSAKSLRFYNGGTQVMNVNVNGNVGIGTTAPTQAKLVVSGSVSSSVPTGYAYSSAGQLSAGGPYPRNVSIYSSNSIWASDLIIVSSDKRIKNISGVSDGAADLGTLMGIEVTNYSYKDVISKGNSEQKKLIAQQVETVFPQAVSKRTDAVPDIYQKAALNDGWVQLATDLKKGERVKLIAGKEEGVHEVLEVGDGKFRTDFKSADAGLFVYGREVNDFRTVDYDAIAMLNVSATQELKREKDAELQTLRDENAALRRELAAKDASLEAKDSSLEKRLIALERRMSGDGATETVSLKTAQAVK